MYQVIQVFHFNIKGDTWSSADEDLDLDPDLDFIFFNVTKLESRSNTKGK